MYQSVYEMASSLGLKPTPGFRLKQIKAHIVLDRNGSYQRLSVTDSSEKTLCPDAGFSLKGFTGNYSAKFLTDSASVVLYPAGGHKKDKAETCKNKHSNYVRQISMGESFETLSSINCFLKHFDSEPELQMKVEEDLKGAAVKSDDILSFRIDVNDAERDTTWIDWYLSMVQKQEDASAKQEYYSLLTGDAVTPVDGKFPKWVGGKAGSGIPVYSDSMRGPGDSPVASTKSYGTSSSCVMSEEEANTIIRGLDYILNEMDQYSPEFNIAWWYDTRVTQETDIIRRTACRIAREKQKKESKEEKEARILRENRKRSREYTDLLRAAEKGERPAVYAGKHRYHIVTISFPEKGRMLTEGEYEDTYQSLYDHLNRWYLQGTVLTSYWDTALKKSIYYPRTIKNIYEILYALNLNSKDGNKDGKNDMYRKEKLELLQAVYQGKKIPEKLIRIATDQYTRYISGFDKEDGTAMQCIQCLEKIFLLREGGYEMKEELTPANKSVGYQCGRWLAVVDKLQEDSLKQTDKTNNRMLSSKFYKQAKKSPAKTFAMVNDYIQIYEDRLEKALPGSSIRYDKLFGEISENIGTYYPDRLPVAEQGAFDLGFAQQKQAFYKKNPEVNEAQNTEASGNE